MSEASRGVKAGERMADALLEWAHMMYNQATARRVLTALISRLRKTMDVFEDEDGEVER